MTFYTEANLYSTCEEITVVWHHQSRSQSEPRISFVACDIDFQPRPFYWLYTGAASHFTGYLSLTPPSFGDAGCKRRLFIWHPAARFTSLVAPRSTFFVLVDPALSWMVACSLSNFKFGIILCSNWSLGVPLRVRGYGMVSNWERGMNLGCQL